jgi:hypothetical protein
MGAAIGYLVMICSKEEEEEVGRGRAVKRICRRPKKSFRKSLYREKVTGQRLSADVVD